MIRITAKKDGFRRCGVAHSAKPVEYADDRFSPAELKRLAAESMLVVERIADPSQGKNDDDKNKGKGK
jgi:3'-phosphoadenosine 5'-phosphosulfate sulfotransferase (PAPS reductase)/FAD synthetase